MVEALDLFVALGVIYSCGHVVHAEDLAHLLEKVCHKLWTIVSQQRLRGRILKSLDP